jgi:hypothetical protein
MAMSSVTMAITDAFENIHGLGDAKHVLFGRQDENPEPSSNAPQTTAPPRSSNQPTATSAKSDKDSASTTSRASESAKASGSQGSRVVTGKANATTSFDPRLPAGGISMVTPNALAGEQFYKVGDWVTFAWNYTSLSVTPSYIDVLASCSANQATYTISVNMTASATQVLWNTKETSSGQPPFLTEKYTLLIYDAASSVTAAPRPGYLGVFNQFTFGMYTPQPYVNWTDFQCANCVKNGALSNTEHMTLRVLLFTSGTTVASLLYFAHNFGLW